MELAIDGLPVESPLRADLELVLQEAHRARGVVRRLLDFSRPVEDQRTRSDVNELINQVLPLFHHLARTSGINLITQLSSDLPWISIDSNQIKQVLINLIHNGIQAMPHGGDLTIFSTLEQRQVPDRPMRSAQSRKKSLSVSSSPSSLPVRLAREPAWDYPSAMASLPVMAGGLKLKANPVRAAAFTSSYLFRTNNGYSAHLPPLDLDPGR